MAEYAAGRTPNPCLRCNEKIKFAAVLDRALALGFDAVATGHYARLAARPDGVIEMHRAVDHAKDQSYVLGVLTQEQLAHSLFPLGDTTKAEIRREAERRGLAVARKPDSHDICFISDGDTAGWLRDRLGDGDRADRRHRRRGAGHAPGLVRLHHRSAQGSSHRPSGTRRPSALCARHRAGRAHGDGRSARGARGRPPHRDQAAVVRTTCR